MYLLIDRHLRAPQASGFGSGGGLALGLQLNGKQVQDARVVFGGISGKPWREKPVEDFLKGKTVSTDVINQAMAQALQNAAPLKYNATKIDMAKGLLASGLERLTA